VIPATMNLTLYRGDYYGWRVRLWSDEARTVPYDLTDHTVASQIREKPGDTTAYLVELNCEITLPNIIDVAIDETQWETAPPKSGVWDLEITDVLGHPLTPLGGSVKVIADVTKVTANPLTPVLESISPLTTPQNQAVEVHVFGTGFTRLTQLYQDDDLYGLIGWISDTEFKFSNFHIDVLGVKTLWVVSEDGTSNEITYEVIP